MTVRIAAKMGNCTIIQAYVPTNQATDQDKSTVYKCLEQVYLQVPWRDNVIIGRDMNAKIWEGSPIGRHALGTMNVNGAGQVNWRRLSRDKR